MTTETLFDRGHNQPPGGILPVLPPTPSEEALAAEYAKVRAARDEAVNEAAKELPFDEATHFGFMKRVIDFCDAAGAWKDLGEITTAAQAERLTDFVTGARGLLNQVDGTRKAEKKIWDDMAATVQAAYAPLLAKLKAVLESMKKMQEGWLIRENARIAAEKAEAARIAREKLEEAQREAEAAAARNDISGAVDAEAALKAAQKEVKAAEKPVKASAGSASGGGRAMALRTVAYAEIHNWRQVFMHFENEPRVIETLQSLADAEIRAGRDVPGADRKEKEVAA